ncbi:hypothetical protein ACLBWT_18845 [Paenibacillus sp. D51F]
MTLIPPSGQALKAAANIACENELQLLRASGRLWCSIGDPDTPGHDRTAAPATATAANNQERDLLRWVLS